MNLWGTLVGGFVGTLVLTAAMRGASELRLTRIDLPFLLGTAVTDDRTRAKALGFVMHFVAGQIFALGYFAAFVATGRSGWLFGAALGVVHALFVGTALVNILVPLVHPRMGSPLTGAPDVALLEPPGFLMLNYGVATPLVSLVAHVAYGAIIGGFTAMAS